MATRPLYLGSVLPLTGPRVPVQWHMPSHHLVKHGVVVGMTGSGKTGLVTVLIEETLQSKVPVLVIDVKGDLPNLLLSFPDFAPQPLESWVEQSASPDDTRSPAELASELAEVRKKELEAWSVSEAMLGRYCEDTEFRIITPGSSAGELLHVLSAIERRPAAWDKDREMARSAVSAAISLLLRLIGRESDPTKSKEHALLSILIERRFDAGLASDLGALQEDLSHPPFERVGNLTLNSFISKKERLALAAAMNTLLMSPTFSSWRAGTTLDVGTWLAPHNGRTPCAIVSVAHLDDDERVLVLGMLLEEVLSWVRGLPGSQRLKALVVFDEVYGFLPPHPANPPTKRPLVALMKQARAFGVGVLIATQNPMDLDYRALSNAGLWCIGRLQTDADRQRVVEGLASAGAVGNCSKPELEDMLKQLAPRWFLTRDAQSGPNVALLQPRFAMTYMRGPMTRSEVQAARAMHAKERDST